jgi:hypothetical protein
MKRAITTTIFSVMLVVASIFTVSNYYPTEVPPKTAVSDAQILLTQQPKILTSSSMTVRAQIVDTDADLSLVMQDEDSMLVVETELEVKIGQLVFIDVTQSSGTKYKWSVMPKTKNFRVFNDGQIAVFSSGVPGDYTFFVSCCASAEELDHKIIVIRVLNQYPDPPAPGPNPPNPEPVNPNAPIETKVAYWLDSMSANKGDCARLGQSFNSIAAQIKAGVIPVNKVAAATKESSRTALGHRSEVWTPFMENLQTEIVARSQAGTLKTADDHEKLWKKIGMALNKYAGPSNKKDIIKAGASPEEEAVSR